MICVYLFIFKCVRKSVWVEAPLRVHEVGPESGQDASGCMHGLRSCMPFLCAYVRTCLNSHQRAWERAERNEGVRGHSFRPYLKNRFC